MFPVILRVPVFPVILRVSVFQVILRVPSVPGYSKSPSGAVFPVILRVPVFQVILRVPLVHLVVCRRLLQSSRTDSVFYDPFSLSFPLVPSPSLRSFLADLLDDKNTLNAQCTCAVNRFIRDKLLSSLMTPSYHRTDKSANRLSLTEQRSFIGPHWSLAAYRCYAKGTTRNSAADLSIQITEVKKNLLL